MKLTMPDRLFLVVLDMLAIEMPESMIEFNPFFIILNALSLWGAASTLVWAAEARNGAVK